MMLIKNIPTDEIASRYSIVILNPIIDIFWKNPKNAKIRFWDR